MGIKAEVGAGNTLGIGTMIWLFLWMHFQSIQKSTFALPEADLGLIVTYCRLEIQNVFFCCQLFRIDLADLSFQFVYLFNLCADSWLEDIFELGGLIPNVVLQNQSWIFQMGDLVLDNLSQLKKVGFILMESVS